jgi:hypothetical protein
MYFFFVFILCNNNYTICTNNFLCYSGLRGFTGSKKSAERKRFFMYSAYAWAVPILHVLIVYIIDTNSKENSWFSPGIGKGQCFLRSKFLQFYFTSYNVYFTSHNVVLLILMYEYPLPAATHGKTQIVLFN